MTLLNRLRGKLAGSQHLFEELDDRGVDHNAIHTIEHHFMALERNCLEELGETARFLGFGFGEISKLENSGDDPYFHADVLSRVPILSEDYSVFIPAAREAALLLLLADAHAATYDGWGTMPIKK